MPYWEESAWISPQLKQAMLAEIEANEVAVAQLKKDWPLGARIEVTLPHGGGFRYVQGPITGYCTRPGYMELGMQNERTEKYRYFDIRCTLIRRV